MKKVVVIVDNINSYGGAENSINILLNNLSRENHISLITTDIKEIRKNNWKKNIDYYSIKKRKKFFPRSYISCLNIIDLYGVYRIIKSFKNIDSIIISNIHSEISYFVIPLCKFFCKNVIHIIRDNYLISAGSRHLSMKYFSNEKFYENHYLIEIIRLKYRFNPLRRLLSIMCVKSADKIITPSTPMQKYLKEFGINSLVIYNTLLDDIEPPKLKYNLDNQKIIKILWPSRLTIQKGIFQIYELCKIIDKEKKNWEIICTGTEGQFRKIISLKNIKKLPSCLRFIGWVSDNLALQKVFKDCDVVIYPSICFESFGRVAIESMSLGVPIIASNAGGLQEIIEDRIDGIIINPYDIFDTYNSIEKLTKNPVFYEKLINNGYKKSKLFLFKNLINSYSDLLN